MLLIILSIACFTVLVLKSETNGFSEGASCMMNWHRI